MDSDTAVVATPGAVNYSSSTGLSAFLKSHNISIAVSSYQSGKFYLVGAHDSGALAVQGRFFRKSMGIYTVPNGIILATLYQIIRFENALKPGERINQTYDACFVPRSCHLTGVLDAHDVGLTDEDEVVFVNTRFNCLASPSPAHSFKAIWKPPFVSKIADEDRCHLNGLAMLNGRPRFVTAACRSDTLDGWRDGRTDGGIVMDIDSNAIICEGLSMPHSPRVWNGKLWVLNSGEGQLGFVDMNSGPTGNFKPFAFCPGFVRGLGFHGNFAFVGLSKPRHERFEGLALGEHLQGAGIEAWCGVQVIDLASGECVHWFRIEGAVSELYDVAVVRGCSQPMAIGFANDEILTFITHEPLEGS